MLNKLAHTAKDTRSKGIKAITVIGTSLLITLSAHANPGDKNVQKEIRKVRKQYPDKEVVVKVAEEASTAKTAKMERLWGNDTIQDPYQRLETLVSAEDMEYFNQLKACMQTKDSVEQFINKAVIYAIFQDQELTEDQRNALALGYFEKLAKMPESNYRFWKAWKAKYREDPKYKEKAVQYLTYKTYLETEEITKQIVALEQERTKLNEENTQLKEEYQKWEQEERQKNEENTKINEENTKIKEENTQLKKENEQLQKELELRQDLYEAFKHLNEKK